MPRARPRRAGGQLRDAGRDAHRPRLDGGRRPALESDQGDRRQADHRLRGLRGRRPARAAEGLRAPHPARPRQRRLFEPDQALVARLPGGLLLQAARRLGAPRVAPRRADRALRLPVGPGVQGARGESRGRCAHRARPARPGVRARQRLRRAAERPPRRAAAHPAAARRARRQGRAADRRDRRRPLPPPFRRARPRGAALHPVRRLAEEPEPLEVRHRPLLFQVARGDGPRLPGARGRAAAHARGRRPLQRRDRARPDPAAALPGAGRTRGVRLSGRAVRKRPAKALRSDHARAHRALAVRAQDDQGNGVRRLLPDRLGLHRLRAEKRDRRRAGPWLRGRLAGRVLPRDHQPRPDSLRPPVRAVPQPGPQVDARHRHRLRGGGPGDG